MDRTSHYFLAGKGREVVADIGIGLGLTAEAPERPRRRSRKKGDSMLRRSFRVIMPVVLVVALGGAVSGPGMAAAGRSGAAGFNYTGDAYGTYANLNRMVIAGKTAVTGLGACGAVQAPVHNENTVLTVSEPPLLATGVINTTADAIDSGGVQTAKTTAEVHDANLLAGLITATEVRAVSRTSYNGSTFSVSAAGSGFANLVVAGVPIVVTPPPNTRIDLAGFGHVILNEQKSKVTANSATLTVNMIHVFITMNNPLGIAPGTEIVVAHATSGLRKGVHGTLDGFAYGTKAKVGNVVTSGPSALVVMPCLGTKGNVKTNSVAQVIVPPLFEVGEVVTTAQGTVNETSAQGETTSTVESVDLVSGLVTADLVKADAHASKSGGTFAFSDEGSGFGNLEINGKPLADVGANTKIKIADLGTLWLHRVIRTPNSIEVRMIELIVSEANVFDIPIGTVIQVAVAHASAH
jgi:hypothetical protein